MTILTIDLPDSLAKEASDAGLFAPSIIEALLRETLRRRAINGLFEAADKLVAADFPPLTMDEIQEEVNAVRTRRKLRAPAR